jgi:hypothetical protein
MAFGALPAGLQVAEFLSQRVPGADGTLPEIFKLLAAQSARPIADPEQYLTLSGRGWTRP